MPKIQTLSFPIFGEADNLNVTIQSFGTDSTTCNVVYELAKSDGRKIADGNYTLTQDEFAAWGEDNAYIDQLIANHIGVTIISE